MKRFMILFIIFFGLQSLLSAERKCFNTLQIKEILMSNQSILHYNYKDYTIEVIDDRQKNPKEDNIINMLKKDEVQITEATFSGTNLDSTCTYLVINKTQEKIGEIVITRTHRRCFRPKKVLHALYLGKTTLKYFNKEYQIDQSALGEDQIQEDAPIMISLEQGIRDELFENGLHKIICTYKARKIDSKEDVGIITVTRSINAPSTKDSEEISYNGITEKNKPRTNIKYN